MESAFFEDALLLLLFSVSIPLLIHVFVQTVFEVVV